MITQPVVNAWIIVVLGVALVGFTGFLIYKNWHNRSLRAAWIRRTVVALLLPILALRPGIGEVQETEIYTTQFDIYFVVDTTNSMAAEDWGDEGETRLDQVKKDIDAITKHYAGARYALLTFDSSAIIRAPLTHDSSALMSAVKVMNVEVSKYSSGSSISAANNLLAQTLQENQEAKPDRARLVFFFSDGEQTVEADPESYDIAAPFINTGEVYGYGTEEGGKMKRNDGYIISSNESEYIMDSSQQPAVEALSMIDEENLQTIADEMGVKYQHRTPDSEIEFPEVDVAVYDPSDVTSLKVTADFTWLLAFPLLLLVSAEYIFMYLAYRRTVKRKAEV